MIASLFTQGLQLLQPTMGLETLTTDLRVYADRVSRTTVARELRRIVAPGHRPAAINTGDPPSQRNGHTKSSALLAVLFVIVTISLSSCSTDEYRRSYENTREKIVNAAHARALAQVRTAGYTDGYRQGVRDTIATNGSWTLMDFGISTGVMLCASVIGVLLRYLTTFLWGGVLRGDVDRLVLPGLASNRDDHRTSTRGTTK